MASNGAVIIPPRSTNGSAALGTNDIRPIKPPVEIFDPWAAVAWTAGILVLLAAIACALIWWRKRQVAARNIPVPPHVRARDRLNASLALIHDPRPFCIEVSDAIRIYLEERFHLRAPERTTEEFLRDLQSARELSPEQKQWLGEFLERCDLVKFARFEPAEATLRELHEAALRLVHETQYIASTDAPAELTPPEPPLGPPPLPPAAKDQ